jgi:uncharacterized delta-60 repeat protein
MANIPQDDGGSNLAPGFLVGGGRFALIKLIGEGGMGSVWLAQDERLNERVALKFLSAKYRDNQLALSNLRKETQKSRKLTHPNIIRIHDLFESADEPPFISMEAVDGLDLAQLQRQQPNCIFSWEFLQPIVKQLCDALDYAHGEGVVHRDLKPSNMMLDAKGRLKLADFGLATLTHEPYSSAHPKGYWAGGTINYMSPQQLDGQPAGIPDDIYALGATLYELLTSRTPFYLGEIADQARNTPATPITDRLEEFSLQNEIPRPVRAMIMACLAKQPELRPTSAGAVAEWIGLTAAPTTPATAEVAAPEPEPVKEEPARAEYSTNKRLLLAEIAFAALVVIAGAWWFLHSKGSTDAGGDKPKPAIDPSFNPGAGANIEPRAVAVQLDGKVLVAGRFTTFNNERHMGFVRLNKDGTVDPKSTIQTDGEVLAMTMQPDGKILIGGNFSTVNGDAHSTLVRLNKDLSLDPSFDSACAKRCDIRAILATNNKIYVGGPPMTFHEQKFNHLAQLDYDGNPVTGLTGCNGLVWAIAQQRDGQLLIGGEFNGVGGGRRMHFARIGTDGERDKQFSPNPNKRVFAIAVQPDDKIIVGGSFDQIGGVRMHCVARLNADGSVDQTFNVGAGADESVQAVALQSDGKIVIGGTFHTFDGEKRDCIARLNSDGTLDRSFAPEGSADSSIVVRSIAIAPSGEIVIGGGFTTVDGADRRNIARLKAKP